ncbi:MAG: group I truncated hemoglobin [Actinomycetota bacterium]
MQTTLYKRLGGYDVIAGIVDDLFARLRDDPQFQRFASGRSLDSLKRARQLLVDQLCALAGGPCVYIGRDMKTSHAGLNISKQEWEANMRHAVAALEKFQIPPKEQQEFLALFEQYRNDIVEPR